MCRQAPCLLCCIIPASFAVLIVCFEVTSLSAWCSKTAPTIKALQGQPPADIDAMMDKLPQSTQRVNEIKSDIADMEATTFTRQEELGWLGSTASSSSSCSIVKCTECKRVLLRSRFSIHMKHCKLRQQFNKWQVQSQPLKPEKTRPCTPPLNNTSHNSKVNSKAKKGKAFKQRQASNLNPYKLLLVDGTYNSLHPDAIGKPPLPKLKVSGAVTHPPSPLMFPASSPLLIHENGTQLPKPAAPLPGMRIAPDARAAPLLQANMTQAGQQQPQAVAEPPLLALDAAMASEEVWQYPCTFPANNKKKRSSNPEWYVCIKRDCMY